MEAAVAGVQAQGHGPVPAVLSCKDIVIPDLIIGELPKGKVSAGPAQLLHHQAMVCGQALQVRLKLITVYVQVAVAIAPDPCSPDLLL